MDDYVKGPASIFNDNYSPVRYSADVRGCGTPTKIIAFTDKKEYMGWWMDAKTTTPGFNKLNDEGQYIFIYAVVLDDDGNIMKSRNIQVTMNDTVFDHWDKGNWNVHNAIVSNNTYFKNAQNFKRYRYIQRLLSQ